MKHRAILLVTVTALALSACNQVDETIAGADNIDMQNDDTETVILAENEAESMKKASSGGVDQTVVIALMQRMVDQDEDTVSIAENIVIYSRDAEATALAQRVIDGENKDIAAIEAWLNKQDTGPMPAENGSKKLGNPEKVVDIPKVTTADPEG